MVRKLIRLGLFGRKARQRLQRLQMLEYAEEENRVYRAVLQREGIPLPAPGDAKPSSPAGKRPNS
jgi:hypothetical protein